MPRPFPAEHPYTSHISRFSVFPDTHTSAPCDVAMATDHTYRSVGTQTVLGTPGPYYVTQKAFEKGSRIERHWQLSGGHVTKATDHMTQQKHLWDFPRSLRHQVCTLNPLLAELNLLSFLAFNDLSSPQAKILCLSSCCFSS